LYYRNSHGSSFKIHRFAVKITAHVVGSTGKLDPDVDSEVPLIQFGPARERGPREKVRAIPLRAGGDLRTSRAGNEQTLANHPTIAAFRRVQIRSATLNNGQRGKAGQQFYALKLGLLAYREGQVCGCDDGIEVASLLSRPITVRGRSKMHYTHTHKLNKRGQHYSSVEHRSAQRETLETNRARIPPSRISRPTSTDTGTFAYRRVVHQRRSTRLFETHADGEKPSMPQVEKEIAASASLRPARSVTAVMDIRSVCSLTEESAPDPGSYLVTLSVESKRSAQLLKTILLWSFSNHNMLQ
jgi:hypothetical protein